MQKKTKVYVGMDVHKDTVMMAVLPEGAREPTLVKQLSHDPRGTSSLFGPGGTELQARTAAMHPMAEDGRIMGSMGYGTDVTQGEH